MTENEFKAEMEPLLKQAEAEGKWLHGGDKDLFFTPAELREKQAAGRFQWGPVNWELRDPLIHRKDLERAAIRFKVALEEFDKRLAAL